MNKSLFAVSLVSTVAAVYMAAVKPDEPPVEGAILAHFSPHGGCTEEVVRQIDGARRQVLVQAYSFTSSPIADALIRAHRRQVEVLVVADADEARRPASVVDLLASQGVQVRLDDRHPNAHDKLLIVDRKVVVTGSFNFSRQAEANAENLVTIRSPDLARRYAQRWTEHWEHSMPMVTPPAPQ